MKTIILTALILLPAATVFAQHYPAKAINPEILMDELFGTQDEDINYQELYENLALLLAHPVDLNEATADELRFLNLLSESQIQNLLHHRNESGPLLSVYELQSVPGFDLAIIYKVISFVTVDDTRSQQPLLKRMLRENNYLIIRYDRTLETKAGFRSGEEDETRFRGSEDEIYMRFRTSKPGDFSAGFTVEKDAGEQINWNAGQHLYGFDYYSFHFQLQNRGKLKNLIVGDYQAQFAQGLLIGGNFGGGKGSETVMSVRRTSLGFLPYTSANEVNYKRGAAITYELHPQFTVSAFYSSAWRDASVESDTLEDESSASSLQTTGFHRNESELANRHQLHEQQYGAILDFRKNALNAGIILNTIRYATPLKNNPQPYNQFAFAGSTINNAGVYANYTLNNFTFFSEIARTIGEGMGITAGMLISLTPKLDMATHYRHYQRNFQSPYSSALAESSEPQNESGIYWGWKYSVNRKFSLSGYADLFRFPWLRFRAYAPSDGHEWLLRFSYQPSKNVAVFIQAREESKARNISSDESNSYTLSEGLKRNYWLNCDYGLSQKLKLKTRLQFSTYEIDEVFTSGMALIQDISFDIGKFSIAARHAIFDTDDYDNRHYVFERDVWLAYSLPAYSGTGLRNYIVTEYTINKHVSCWVRFAKTRYTDRDEIGSGADEIKGNTKNDVRLQVKIKF